MIGETVSHYRITKQLGAGGMGVVYEAVDTNLDRTIALKFLPPESTRDPEAKARFIHEAKAASALDHPNVCTVHEIGETENGQLFLAMACYHGETLKEKIARGPLPLDEAIAVTRQMAEGLQAAHEQGIVHRDIKPANIFVTDTGLVKILDFGLAKLAGQTQLTQSGSTVGTAHYMSPEQARGRTTDRRSDLWGLGVVCYEIVTGRMPFQGEYAQAVVYGILNDEPEPVTGLRTGVPMVLERIIAKCLAKDPRERYQTTVDLLVDLNILESRVSGQRGQAAPRTRRSPPARRWFGLTAVVVLLVLGLTILPRVIVSPPETADARPMLVVLPFENLGSPDDDYFAAGMTEEITSRLAVVSGLGVISRTSAVQYSRRDKTVREIGKDLNVDYVLEGSVRWEHGQDSVDRVRVTPQLIRVADDTHLWADNYERELTGVFEVQSQIATTIIEQLHISLLDRERRFVEARPTESMDAYRAYLLGLEHRRKMAFTTQDKWSALRMFERAVELDPGFAIAYAELSRVHSFLYYSAVERSPERRRMAEDAAKKALKLQPDLPEAHMALSKYYKLVARDYSRAYDELQVVKRSRPNDPEVYDQLGSIQRLRGEWEKALDNHIMAFTLDPLNGDQAKEIAYTLMYLRRYREADSYWDRCYAIAPDLHAALEGKASNCWLWHGDAAMARAILDRVPETPLTTDPLWRFLNWFRQELFERDFEAALDRVTALPVDVYEEGHIWRTKEQFASLVYRLMGESQRAHASCEAARNRIAEEIAKRPDDERLHSALALALAGLGRSAEAIREAKRGVELRQVSNDALFGPARIEDLALTYVLVGEIDAALDQIEILLSIPAVFSVPLLELDPRWDPLRDHPRYAEIVARYGVREARRPG